jgi:hypothetical protein
VRLFGLLAFPKKSTQKAGSNENDAKELLCGIEAPSAVFGMLIVDAPECSVVG